MINIVTILCFLIFLNIFVVFIKNYSIKYWFQTFITLLVLAYLSYILYVSEGLPTYLFINYPFLILYFFFKLLFVDKLFFTKIDSLQQLKFNFLEIIAILIISIESIPITFGLYIIIKFISSGNSIKKDENYPGIILFTMFCLSISQVSTFSNIFQNFLSPILIGAILIEGLLYPPNKKLLKSLTVENPSAVLFLLVQYFLFYKLIQLSSLSYYLKNMALAIVIVVVMRLLLSSIIKNNFLDTIKNINSATYYISLGLLIANYQGISLLFLVNHLILRIFVLYYEKYKSSKNSFAYKGIKFGIYISATPFLGSIPFWISRDFYINSIFGNGSIANLLFITLWYFMCTCLLIRFENEKIPKLKALILNLSIKQRIILCFIFIFYTTFSILVLAIELDFKSNIILQAFPGTLLTLREKNSTGIAFIYLTLILFCASTYLGTLFFKEMFNKLISTFVIKYDVHLNKLNSPLISFKTGIRHELISSFKKPIYNFNNFIFYILPRNIFYLLNGFSKIYTQKFNSHRKDSLDISIWSIALIIIFYFFTIKGNI